MSQHELKRKLDESFARKQDKFLRIKGWLGDSQGTVQVPGRENYTYVTYETVSGSTVPAEVFNVRTPYTPMLAVWVGFDPDEPSRAWQVLGLRQTDGEETNALLLGPHAETHRWLGSGIGGGMDVVFVEGRQFMPFRIGADTGLSVALFRGVYKGNAWYEIAHQSIDLTALVPVTADKAKFVLITLSTTGTVVTTTGSEVDDDALALTDIPAAPAGTKYELAAIRLYEGQTAIQESRTSTDIVDLRFPIAHTHDVSEVPGAGSGDMTKAVYDTDNDGIVDNAEALGGVAAADYLTEAEHTAIGNGSPHHAAVTLAADADTLLGLSGQELNIDNQDANKFLAGPTSGAAADPTFRALVEDDLPAHSHAGSADGLDTVDQPAVPFDVLISSDGYPSNYTNSLQYRFDAIASMNLNGVEYQAITYWNSSGQLVIGKRVIDGDWTLYTFTGITVTDTDAHRGASLGLDPNGYIHVAYDHGGSQNALHYRKSDAPISTWTGTLTAEISMVGTNENLIVYPTFFNDVDGNLYFIFRHVDDIYFYEYDHSTTIWSAATGTSTGGIFIDGATDSQTAYMLQPWFDARGILHLFYMWSTAVLNTRHNVSYVKWDKTNFYQADGSAQTIPIREANAEIIDAISDTAISQHTGAMTDAFGRPHAVYAYYPALPGQEDIRHIYWTGSAWVTYTWQDVTVDSSTIGIYPRILIDDQNVVRILYVNPDTTSDGILMKISAQDDFTTWWEVTLYPVDVGIYMPKFDAYQWRNHRIMYLSVEPYFASQADLDILVLKYAASGWAVWDAENYQSLHANDIDTATGIHHTLGSGANQAAAGDHSHAAGADEKAKVSANDTTAGYLNGKLVQGTGITLTENNDGGNETLTIAATATGQYRQFLYEVVSGDLTFLTDEDGFPLFVLSDLE